VRPGALFVGALVVFAMLGLLAGRAPAPRELGQAAPSPAAIAPDHDVAPPGELAKRWGVAFTRWTDRSLARKLRGLASSATSGLAAELRRGAKAVQRDRSLTRDGAGSRGAVEVVDVTGRGRRRRILVVTRETPYVASGTELQGPRYRVYVGTVVRTETGRWLMQSWERQP
jgi:hypothetical protein